jgi:hypothetical protein
VAITNVAEVGDFRRFATMREQLMAYLGLVASEHYAGSGTLAAAYRANEF